MAVAIMLLTSLAAGPTKLVPFLVFLACCMPFFADFGLSLGTTYSRITSPPRRTGGATVTEINDVAELTPANEEAFISADRATSSASADDRGMIAPSDRLVPASVREVAPVYNLLTSDWKENAAASYTSTGKQLTAFALIAGFLYFGGAALGGEAANLPTATGAVTLACGASSLLGYFGLADAPVAKLMRTNMVSVLGAILAVLSMVTGGMSLNMLALAMMQLTDAFIGATYQPEENHANKGDF